MVLVLGIKIIACLLQTIFFYVSSELVRTVVVSDAQWLSETIIKDLSRDQFLQLHSTMLFLARPVLGRFTSRSS